MNTWLVKTEPNCWSWDDQRKKGIEHWDGVRNWHAARNMQMMKIGDLAFFYHTGKEKQIVGIVRIVKEYYPDHTDETGKFGMVDVETVKELKRPVTLAEVKADQRFTDLPLVRLSRLSVQPVDKKSWQALCAMGGVKP